MSLASCSVLQQTLNTVDVDYVWLGILLYGGGDRLVYIGSGENGFAEYTHGLEHRKHGVKSFSYGV